MGEQRSGTRGDNTARERGKRRLGKENWDEGWGEGERRAEGVGGWLVGRWYKGREAAHSVIGKAKFGANVITEGDGKGLGGRW